MLTLTMIKGLPASGKTTWAKNQVTKSNGMTKRVNKDELRAMVDAGIHSKNREKQILVLRNLLVNEWLNGGYSVIVDDTNLSPKHETTLKAIAKRRGAHFQVIDFNTAVSICEERDSKRENSVGKKVIRKMWTENFVQPAREKYLKESEGLPAVILSDTDGTLAHMKGRSPYDYSHVLDDELDEDVLGIIEDSRTAQPLQVDLILMSGRPESAREDTERWLETHGIKYLALYMRPDGDNREDSIVKKELFETRVKGRFRVRFVLDDRNRVVDMWREQGLKCFQVADGSF